MNIYKLKYQDKKTAIADLLAKQVYIETEEGMNYNQGVHAVVEIGKIVLENATYDENGNELTQPTFIDGYHYDVMCENKLDFNDNEIIVNTPRHFFSGY